MQDRAWLVLAIAALVGFVGLTVALALGVTFPFDQPLLTAARGLDGWPFLWQAVSQSANIPLIVIGVAFVLGLLIKHRYHEAILVVIILVAVTAGSEGVKQLTARVRPSGTGDGIPGVVYSYPSGHVLECMTILGMVAIRFWRTTRHDRLKVVLVAAVVIEVVLVGIARLALDEHYFGSTTLVAEHVIVPALSVLVTPVQSSPTGSGKLGPSVPPLATTATDGTGVEGPLGAAAAGDATMVGVMSPLPKILLHNVPYCWAIWVAAGSGIEPGW